MKLEEFDLRKILENLDDKKLMSISKKIANIYRKLPEYSNWSLKLKEGKNKCESCGREFIEDIIEPEIHHTPETLTELVYNIIFNLLDKEEPFNTLDILKALNDMHYNGLVGYSCICECCHNLLHKQKKAKKT